MRILVCGALGMLGHDVVGATSKRGHEVIALGRAELDVADLNMVTNVIRTRTPDVVINCAAWTDVDGAEENEFEATKINGDGPGNLASAISETNSFLVHISSDYVFDGNAHTPYRENDPTNPQSAYGRSKLAGEHAIERNLAASRWAIARSSWLFGIHGRNFVDTILTHARKRAQTSVSEPLTVVDDQVGCPTWTVHLAEALLTLAEQRAAGIWHLAASTSCSWFELATAAIAASHIDCKVLPMKSNDLDRPAARPAYSVLGHSRVGTPVLPSWQDGLAGYLKLRKSSSQDVGGGAGRNA